MCRIRRTEVYHRPCPCLYPCCRLGNLGPCAHLTQSKFCQFYLSQYVSLTDFIHDLWKNVFGHGEMSSGHWSCLRTASIPLAPVQVDNGRQDHKTHILHREQFRKAVVQTSRNLQVMAQWKVNFRRVCLAFALALTTFWAVTGKVVTYSMHSEQVSSMLKESSKTASFCKLRQDTARASGLRN